MQIAVLDPTLRSRELARRAICRLGHVPVTFESLDQLRQHGEQVSGFGVLLVACPRDPAVFQPLIAEVRGLLGHQVPLILVVSKSQFRVISVLHADAFSAVEHAPATFEDTYRLLESDLLRRRMPIAPRVLRWQGYRFIMDEGVAELDGEPVKLRPREFDLAVAFFRNVNRLLTRDWILANVWGEKEKEKEENVAVSRSLDVSVSGLRTKLGLHLKLQAVWGQGYQLSDMAAPRGFPMQARAEEPAPDEAIILGP